ncbi:hypothetical protein GGX14DRAFT_393895 [Mycena pura]|uniref:XPG N-terminal domain-containing protein n=1 Tax=Mycena pura TaxID=153505 RepID=A0AAD6YE17_9AGAR|nr:hypothetical protein GGX14DRAFT_393895 [Mycena pura]
MCRIWILTHMMELVKWNAVDCCSQTQLEINKNGQCTTQPGLAGWCKPVPRKAQHHSGWAGGGCRIEDRTGAETGVAGESSQAGRADAYGCRQVITPEPSQKDRSIKSFGEGNFDDAVLCCCRGDDTMPKTLAIEFQDSTPSSNDDMAIPELWEFVLEKGFKNDGGECQPMIMGVDARVWMYQAEHAIRNGNAQPGPNPHLRVLFYKLNGLLELPVRVSFVFDGPARPQFQARHSRAHPRPHRLTAQFLQLIHGFGYHSHMPKQTLNWVVLDRRATLMVPQKEERLIQYHHVYRREIDKLFTTRSVSLTRGGILLITLGDYHEEFPVAVSIATAHAVACGNLSDMLLATEFSEFLSAWKEALCY